MPKMVLKQESRLNGVKTNIFNLDEVAKALRVPEEGKKFVETIIWVSYEFLKVFPKTCDALVGINKKFGEDNNHTYFIAIIKYWCTELGTNKEKTTILKG